jgi:sugar-specific transcriptional regulator TrmB
LIKKGFATQVPRKKINQYQAINPAVVAGVQKTALKNFSEMLPLLQTLHNRGEGRPKINYIETEKGILNIYEEMNNAKESFFITSHSKIEKHFPGAVREWVRKNKKGIYKFTGKNLIPENKEDIELAKTFKDANKNVRYLPGIEKLDMDFVVYENKLAITSLGDRSFMVSMESEKLAASMKSIFELLWKIGKEIK